MKIIHAQKLIIIDRGYETVACLPYEHFDWSIEIGCRAWFSQPRSIFDISIFGGQYRKLYDVGSSKVLPK